MRTWMYGLTGDEWLTLASAGQDSEIGPCCGNISQLREALQILTTSQEDASWFLRDVIEAYEMTVRDHDTLNDPERFPLLHRVLEGVRSEMSESCTDSS